jgi:hypothetical protein
MRNRISLIVGVLLIAAFAGTEAQPPASSTFRESFENNAGLWRPGVADSPYQEVVNQLDDKVSHGGRQSAFLRLLAKLGTHIYYWYPIPRAEIIPDLKVSVWVRANRPGMRLTARAVLPRERQAKNLDQPQPVIVTGDVYQATGQWQLLRIRDVKRELQSQVTLLQGELNRKVNLEGAFIDQVQLNVYSGPGEHQVWLDDLEVTPILSGAVNEARSEPGPDRSKPPVTMTTVLPKVELTRNKLVVNKQPFFLRGIRYTDANSLPLLRELGFNTLWVDGKTPETALTAATREGFWLVPELRPPPNGLAGLNSNTVRNEIDRFAKNEHVLAWQITAGPGLTAEDAEVVSKSLRGTRTSNQLYAGSVWSGYREYSQSQALDMVGVHRWPLFSSLNPIEYRDWLVSRSRLAQPEAYFWTWVQTHIPEPTRVLLTGVEKSKTIPDLGPEPAQIRLMSALALSAGYRGLGFWADQSLSEERLGKARRLELALINQQFNLLEPYLATMQDAVWIKTKDPRIHAAVLRCEGGFVVLPVWTQPGTQYVAGPCYVKNLELVIPGLPIDIQIHEVVPGNVRSVHHQRTAGGAKVVLSEFSVTTALLCTNDATMIGRLQQKAQHNARIAAQWAYDAAREELSGVEAVHDQLKAAGMDRPYDYQLREEAYKSLQEAYQAFTRGNLADFRLSFEASQKSGQYVRQLMRNHWEFTTKGLSSPVSSPYTVSYYTLPRYYQWLKLVNQSQHTGNLLRDGDCEAPAGDAPAEWSVRKDTLDEVQLAEARVSEQPHDGRQCWKLSISAKDPATEPEALERTFLAVSSPGVALNPGTTVRLSGWVRIPTPLKATSDGLLIYDNAGSEALALRFYHCPQWKKFELYRQVPASGQVNLSLALTGIGTVYFDDLTIEAVNPLPGAVSPVK